MSENYSEANREFVEKGRAFLRGGGYELDVRRAQNQAEREEFGKNYDPIERPNC